jgi:hypothetical protein
MTLTNIPGQQSNDETNKCPSKSDEVAVTFDGQRKENEGASSTNLYNWSPMYIVNVV